MKKRVLVTGASGFTGRYLCLALEEAGYEVFGTSRDADETCEFELLPLDLQDQGSIRSLVDHVRPLSVVHLAAISSVDTHDLGALLTVNVAGTDNLLRALLPLADRLERVIVASSAQVYDALSADVLDEGAPFGPKNGYAISKAAMEFLIRTFSERLPVVVSRPFNYTGVGQKDDFLVPKIVSHFRERRPEVRLGNLDVTRDFLDVRCVVDAYLRLLEAGAPGQAYNICSGRGVSIREIFNCLRDLSGHSPELVSDPALRRSNEIVRIVGSPEKLRRLTTYQPIDFKRTLAWMLTDDAQSQRA